MKRRLLNAVSDLSGYTHRRWSKRPPGLYCFNFHRVGNDDRSAFHPNLFSCTASRFAEILAFLQSEFEMVDIERVCQIVARGASPTERLALITFDDGYLDNFEVAYGVLRAARCPAVFFLQTDFIDGTEVPWWDRIAWCVWHHGDGEFRLPGVDHPVSVRADDPEGSIRRVLRAVKDAPGVVPIDEIVRAIEAQCARAVPTGQGRLAMTWDQVAEMRAGGMDIGSHTRSHRILSHLSIDEQRFELMTSKEILESRTGGRIDALAYPVGGFATYTVETKRLARECGFRVGFNFEHGINLNPAANPFDLRRLPVQGNPSVDDLRREIALAYGV